MDGLQRSRSSAQPRWDAGLRQNNDGADSAAPALALFLILLALKLVTVVAIVLLYPHHEAVILQIITSWPWVVVPVVALAAPAIAWYRRLRVRARRSQLLEAEWRQD
jgi:hypothetical protein